MSVEMRVYRSVLVQYCYCPYLPTLPYLYWISCQQVSAGKYFLACRPDFPAPNPRPPTTITIFRNQLSKTTPALATRQARSSDESIVLSKRRDLCKFIEAKISANALQVYTTKQVPGSFAKPILGLF